MSRDFFVSPGLDSADCLPSELLSEGDVEKLLQVTGCSTELQTPGCQTDCSSERYRSITGECNNRSELVVAQLPHSLMFCSGNFLCCVLFCADNIQGGGLQTPRTPVGCLQSTRMCGGCPEAGSLNTPTTTSACLQ